MTVNQEHLPAGGRAQGWDEKLFSIAEAVAWAWLSFGCCCNTALTCGMPLCWRVKVLSSLQTAKGL